MFRDYHCLLLEDCAAEPIGAGTSRSNHDASLLLFQVFFGRVSQSSELLATLAREPVLSGRPWPADLAMPSSATMGAAGIEPATLACEARSVLRRPLPLDVYKAGSSAAAWRDGAAESARSKALTQRGQN